MSVELLVNVTPRETRVALIENGMLKELFVERANRRGLVGSIFKGRVCRVLPGMQAAFVDVGLERAAFLHASDIVSPNLGRQLDDEADHATGPRPPEDPSEETQPAARSTSSTAPTHRSGSTEPDPPPTITELVREGQDLLVQVIKDPIGGKGARLTTSISIPSCYLVYMPGGNTIGVSQRIEDEPERERLRDLVREQMRTGPLGNKSPAPPDRQPAGNLGDTYDPPSHSCDPVIAASPPTPASADHHPGDHPGAGNGRANNGAMVDGYIVRTAAESVPDATITADMDFLHRLWRSIEDNARRTSAPNIVHEDLPLVIRTLRELSGTEIERARIDSRETLVRVKEFTAQFIPEMASRMELYTGERPIFDLYGVDDEIQKGLDRKVQLKSGGYLIIDQTEAMTTIDVNTGAYVGHRNLEETIFKTNLEAATSIARQLQLRNLGGIIIIDFIDMVKEDHKRQVLRALERALEKDHTKTHISEVSSLGLVQMTRKRTRESLEHVLCEACPTCNGRGSIKTPDTVCYEIFREILREARQYDTERFLVLASQEVVDTLMDEESTGFAELEAFICKPITLQVEALYSREQYDVVLM